MKKVRILDMDAGYARALGTYLSGRIPDCGFVIGDTADPGEAEGGGTIAAVVAGAGYLNWEPADGMAPVLRLSPGIGEEDHGPARLGGARAIAEALERLLGEPENDAGPEGPRVPAARVTGFLTDACDRVRREDIAHLLADVTDRGGRAVYLPFLPVHRAACRPMGGGGMNLTRLLLIAAGEDPDPETVGACLHPARSGVLCMGAAENHGHLSQCGPDALRRVVVAVGRWMARQHPESLAVADIAEIPDDEAAAILAACGGLRLLCAGEDRGRSGFTARIAPLTSRLPPGCRVVRTRISPPCAPDTARAGTNSGKEEENP
ncbi:MAG: hypothetical protein KBA30_06250 [Clostridia bacterium]|nr:hypothetical protein [Clostridia bacterium]